MPSRHLKEEDRFEGFDKDPYEKEYDAVPPPAPTNPFEAIQVNDLASPKAMDDISRAARALELRRRGYNFAEIAKTCGFKSERAAYNTVKIALERTLQEPAEELRTLESSRLDAALRAIWDHVVAGSLDHIKAMLLIMERRAKLLGLDTPPKQAGITLNFIDLAMQAAKAIDHVPSADEVNSLSTWATQNLEPALSKMLPPGTSVDEPVDPIKATQVVPSRQKQPITAMADIYRQVQELTGKDLNELVNPQ